MMDISQDGLMFIARFEGFKSLAYKDEGGVLTVGFGHTGNDVYQGQSVTINQALKLLRQDAENAVACVNEVCSQYQPNQNQFDALVSFAFNLGCESLKRMLAHGWASIPEQIVRWDNIKGVTSQGLLNRRKAELALFLS